MKIKTNVKSGSTDGQKRDAKRAQSKYLMVRGSAVEIQ